jgi:hypothetical protein
MKSVTRKLPRNGRRKAAIVGIAAAAAMSAAFVPASASATVGEAPAGVATRAAQHTEVRLVRLICQQTEDSTGADEPYLLYNGVSVFGPGVLNDGQSAELGLVRPLSGEARVDLFDEDWPDADDYLGGITISAWELNQGLRSQDFTQDGAHYTLLYRVTEAISD